MKNGMKKLVNFVCENWVMVLTALVMVIAPVVATYVANTSIHNAKAYVDGGGYGTLWLVTWPDPSGWSLLGHSLLAGLCLLLALWSFRKLRRAEESISFSLKGLVLGALVSVVPCIFLLTPVWNVMLADSPEAWGVGPLVFAGIVSVGGIVGGTMVAVAIIAIMELLSPFIRRLRRLFA